jgi:trigger factor
MSVVTAIEDAGPCLKKLTIEIPATAVQAETGRVVDEFSRQVRIPGFRPGKVPVAMVKKRFRQEIEKEIVDRLLPRYWKQAQAEKDIEPLIAPKVDDLKYQEGEPMLVTISVETRPEIALGDYQSFDLPQESAEPNEAEIDAQLDQLRKQQGRWLPVDREAARGDLVIADMKPVAGDPGHAHEHGDGEHGHDHGHDHHGHEAPRARPLFVEIGAADSDEEMSLALTGQKAGSTFRHKQRHGDGEHAHFHDFDVTVREVKEQQLPELTDEWAKELGDFDSVGQLREVVVQRLRERKEDDLRRRRENALLDQLRSRHPLALPEGAVRQETERMMQQWAEQIAEQGADLQQIDWERLSGDFREPAEKRVHARLLLDAIARKDGIRLDESVFESFLAAAASAQKTHSLALRQRLAEEGRLEGIRSQMLRDQTLAHMLGEKLPAPAEAAQD